MHVPHLPYLNNKNQTLRDLSYVNPSSYDPRTLLEDVVRYCQTLPDGSVLGFHGNPSSGKTTAARWVANELGWKFAQGDDFNYWELHHQEKTGFDYLAMRKFVQGCRVRRISVVLEHVAVCKADVPDVLVQLEGGDERAMKKLEPDYEALTYAGLSETFRGRYL